jgi:hypothetical protein
MLLLGFALGRMPIRRLAVPADANQEIGGPGVANHRFHLMPQPLLGF